ncbi:MAG: NADH-quinone oxidoreductase subunit G [Actinobacteria bacterium]|nr:NADH-quinone oxidoreductase subunit G [Actinomycetota bacterium]
MSTQELQPDTQVEMTTVTIDGFEVTVPKGTLVIRAAEKLGIQIPRFCDHPLLDPVGACRQCLVEIEINGRKFPKPQASCTIPVEPGMIVNTQLTSPVADKAQQGIMELLLINHPLDCPVCDKGGECPLQNQAMSNGRGESRYEGYKRTFEKPINISSQVLLDRERCILCARCTRFSEQIAGDPFITLNERGALQQVGIYENDPFESYFSGNTVQICPVGALTGASYRFRARPFDLVSTPSACEHCASGCDMRTDVRRGKTLRRLAGDDPQVNEEWNCDKGRWAFKYVTQKDRITTPLVRDENGELREASWPEALQAAAAGLEANRTAVLVGGRATLEDAYGYSKFARVALGTNDIDFRARVSSREEQDFLASYVVGKEVNYKDLDRADQVVLLGFEPEEESPIVFLRLYKQVRKRSLSITTVAPFATRGSEKLNAKLIKCAAGNEASVIPSISGLTSKSVILVGERLAEAVGGLSAAAGLANSSGAKLAWIPRRAGERGALEAGAIGNLLPGGRPVSDTKARVDIQTAWGVDSLPASEGRDTEGILKALHDGEIESLLIGGVDPLDISAHLHDGLKKAFVVSLEIRKSAITEIANVVLPVAAVVEKSGTFVNWEGRSRSFDVAVADSLTRSDVRILSILADEMGAPINLPTVSAAAKEFNSLGNWDESASFTPTSAKEIAHASSEALLSSWRLLLDAGSLQDGEANLAGTAHPSVAVISKSRAEKLGVANGDSVRISTSIGSITLPCEIKDMEESSVWIPRNSATSKAIASLGAVNGPVSVVKA